MNDAAQIVVILPVYNGGNYLKLSINSVLSQTYKNFKFFIIDDCSTDGSWEYLQSITDSRIKLYKNDINRGLFYNLNLLINKSTTNWIKLWSQDDIMMPFCLEDFLAFANNNPQLGFIYSGYRIIDENGNEKFIEKVDYTPAIITPDFHTKIAMQFGSIAGNIANVAINRTAFNEVGNFNESMVISADFEMWIRLSEKRNIGFIKKNLIYLRNHSKQLSRNENYFLKHVIEDAVAYDLLKKQIGELNWKSKRKLFIKGKALFYCTLMFKCLLKGKLMSFIKYFSTISSIENIFVILYYFIKIRILKI